MKLSKPAGRLIIAVMIALAFIGVLLALTFLEIPERNHDIYVGMVGFLGGAFLAMIAFYFGSSDDKPEA